MTGLETAAAIAGICSTLMTGGKLIHDIYKNRTEKKLAIDANTQAAESQLVTTLHNGPPRINYDYARFMAHIGPQFSQLDHIASQHLLSIVVDMNNSLVGVIEGFLRTGRVVIPAHQYNVWNHVGSRSVDNTVTSLTQFHQRKLLAAPIPMGISSYGSRTFDSGDTYTGQWENGKPHGFGVYIWANGFKYEGEFKDGHPSGLGTELSTDGVEYTGQWKDWNNGTGWTFLPNMDPIQGPF